MNEPFFSQEKDRELLESVADFFIAMFRAGTRLLQKEVAPQELSQSSKPADDVPTDNVVPFS